MCTTSILGLSSQLFVDHIFDDTVTNEKIFHTMAKPIVAAALRGFNGTIFAYGQTSSGNLRSV